MQTVGLSKDLSTAINFLEEILNNKDSEAVIETIKKYKQMKANNEIGAQNFSID